VNELQQWHVGELLLVEPNIKELPMRISNARLVPYADALEESDVTVILVDHKEFNTLSFTGDFIVDTKGVI